MTGSQGHWISSVTAVVPSYLFAPLVTVAWLVLLWFIKRLFFMRLKAWAAKTTTVWDDLVIRSLTFPLDFLIVASGLAILLQMFPLPHKIDRLVTIALQGSIVLAIVMFLDGLIRGFMSQSAARSMFGPVSQGLTKGLLRGFVIVMGVLIFMDLIGISITPVLASLGIGSLAVALALQDTLSNFFAGIYVTIDKPVQVGDFIKIDGGAQGYVIDIGWRSTRIRELPNNVIIIPNTKLMGSIITNYYMPDREVAVTVDMGVHYQSDLKQVETIVSDVAREVIRSVAGGVKEFEPFIRYNAFGDSSVDFSVILRGKEFTDSYLIKHEFIKAVHERFRKEGIVIPYPTRALTVETETIRAMSGFLPSSRQEKV